MLNALLVLIVAPAVAGTVAGIATKLFERWLEDLKKDNHKRH